MATTSISSHEFIALSANPNNVIDVRTAAEVRGESLAGSHNLPLQSLETDALLAIAEKAGGPVYLLCKAGQRAQLALQTLPTDKQDKFIVIDGGIDALKAAGAELVQSAAPVMSLERQVRIAAGALVFIGCMLGFFVHQGFFALSTFVGAGLMFAGITNTCAMGMVIARMPWNR